MMCETYVKDGVEFVQFDDKPRALGLKPDLQPVLARTLSEYLEIPSRGEMIRRVESNDWSFGEDIFASDWTKDQNGWGKCASTAATYAIQKARHMRGQRRIELSDDYLYSLVNDGADRGSTLGENMRAIMTRGIATRATVGHGDIYRSKYDTRKADKEALRFRGHEAFLTPGEQEVCAALLARIPVVIAIHVGRNWQNFDSRGVLIGDRGPGNHSEHLDDIRYNRQAGRFEFRKHSSHGKRYGDGGFCWIHYGHLNSVHSSHAKYAVPGAIDDPQGDFPFQDEFIDDQDDQDESQAPKLIVTSSEFCDWCKKWDRMDRQRVKDAGIIVEPGSVPGSGVPRFKLIVGDREYTQVGYWPAAEILSTVAELKTKIIYGR